MFIRTEMFENTPDFSPSFGLTAVFLVPRIPMDYQRTPADVGPTLETKHPW